MTPTTDSAALLQRLFEQTHLQLNKAISDKILAYAETRKWAPHNLDRNMRVVHLHSDNPHILDLGRVERKGKHKTVLFHFRIYQQSLIQGDGEYLRVGFQVTDTDEPFEPIQVNETETI